MRLAQTIYGGCPHKLGLPYTKICDFHQASNDDTITESATPGVPGGGEELLLLITSCLKPGGQRCSIPKTWRDVREIVGAAMSGYLDGIATRDGFVTHCLPASAPALITPLPPLVPFRCQSSPIKSVRTLTTGSYSIEMLSTIRPAL
jgi:hypothetical protein